MAREIETLEQIASSERAFARSKPSIHPLGFLRLQSPDENPRVRIHAWGLLPLSPQGQDFLVHDHNFSFRSTCVLGVTEYRRWSVTSVKEAATHSLFRVIYGESSSSMERVSGCIAAPSSMWSAPKKGDSYAMEIGEFHEARSSSRVAVTFVQVLETSNLAPQVVGPLAAEPLLSFFRRPVTPEEMRKARKVLADYLELARSEPS
jgi:hypothetical protein